MQSILSHIYEYSLLYSDTLHELDELSTKLYIKHSLRFPTYRWTHWLLKVAQYYMLYINTYDIIRLK